MEPKGGERLHPAPGADRNRIEMDKAKWRTIPGFTKIGILGKSYGTSGEMRLRVDPGFEEDVLNAQYLFVDIAGSRIPFEIDRIRVAKDVLITFANVDDRDEAINLAGNDILLPEDEIDADKDPTPPSDLRFGHFVGFTITDNETSERVGVIVDIQEFPQQEMAIVKRGDAEVMIPLHEDLIVSVDEPGKHLVMDLPHGLLDL